MKTLSLTNSIKEIKYFIQRGRRGWADKDVWDVDYYLSKIIPPMITYLREVTHGHPADLSEKEWDEILEKIEQGFIASQRMQSSEYSIEEYEADEKIFNEGMELLAKWYFGLWD